MKVALCCIGRLENRYIKEFVEHYKKIGVDKIFIYDNNHDEEEHFEDVIECYIKDNFVDIINYRNKENCQLMAYQDCYNRHRNEFDWMLYTDCGDEYLELTKFDNVKDFLNQNIFDGYDLIHINLLTYGDNDLIYYEDKPLCERFKKPVMPLNFCKNYSIPENCHVSSIVRCSTPSIVWGGTPHTPSNDLNCCDAKGNKCDSTSPFLEPFNFDEAFFRHYTTKTIEEFYTIKVKRGFPDGNKDYFKYTSWIREFFRVNKKNKEKVSYLEKINNDNIDFFIGTYKTFTPPITNVSYKIIYGNHNIFENDSLKWYKLTSDEKLDDRFYSEIYMLKNIPSSYKLKDYVGFCHYRKYFEFLDKIPNLNEIFKNYDVVLIDPIKFSNTVREQYGESHNIDDFNIIENVIKNYFHEYYDSFKIVSERRYLYPANMFIMKKNDFKEYIKFISDVLDKYLGEIGYDIEKRIEENKNKYDKIFCKENTLKYQYRIGGYLAERLTNVFVEKKFNKIKTYGMKITELKYE